MSHDPSSPEPAAERTPLAPVGRRARKALATRRALFDAGLAAFARQPLGLVSVLDITEAADVAKGVFYLHFPSKDDYLLALWEDVQNRFIDDLRRATDGVRARNARLDAALNRVLAFADRAPEASRFWIRMASHSDGEIGEPGQIARLRRAYLNALATILAGGRGSGTDAIDIRDAVLVDAIGWGVITVQQVDGAPVRPAETMVRIMRSALRRTD